MENIELLPVQNLEEGVVMDQDDSKPSKTVTPEAPTIILVTPSLSEDPEFKMGSGNHSKESQVIILSAELYILSGITLFMHFSKSLFVSVNLF